MVKKIKRPNIWNEFTNHLNGSHKKLLRLINKHTDMIQQLQNRVKQLEEQSKSLSKPHKTSKVENKKPYRTKDKYAGHSHY